MVNKNHNSTTQTEAHRHSVHIETKAHTHTCKHTDLLLPAHSILTSQRNNLICVQSRWDMVYVCLIWKEASRCKGNNAPVESWYPNTFTSLYRGWGNIPCWTHDPSFPYLNAPSHLCPLGHSGATRSTGSREGAGGKSLEETAIRATRSSAPLQVSVSLRSRRKWSGNDGVFVFWHFFPPLPRSHQGWGLQTSSVHLALPQSRRLSTVSREKGGELLQKMTLMVWLSFGPQTGTERKNKDRERERQTDRKRVE